MENQTPTDNQAPQPPPSVDTVRNAPRVTKLEKENANLQDQLSQEKTMRQELEQKFSLLKDVPARNPETHKSLLDELDELVWGPKIKPQPPTQ